MPVRFLRLASKNIHGPTVPYTLQAPHGPPSTPTQHRPKTRLPCSRRGMTPPTQNPMAHWPTLGRELGSATDPRYKSKIREGGSHGVVMSGFVCLLGVSPRLASKRSVRLLNARHPPTVQSTQYSPHSTIRTIQSTQSTQSAHRCVEKPTQSILTRLSSFLARLTRAR